MTASDAKTVVITGAGSGIGRAVAQRFAAEAWNVALVGRTRATLDETVSTVDAADRSRCVTFTCDVSQPAEVEAMSSEVIARFGSVAVLVNAAGINVPRRSLRDLSLDDWHRVVGTNLNGAYYCIRAFLPSMRDRRDGTIVNINSDVGKIARDLAGPAYVTSKFGMTGLTQQINAEERANGIRATSIFPRDVNTPLLDKRPQPPPADVRARMLQPEDLAACVWLAATLPPRAIVDEIVLSTR
jgi:NAD(P)-dependent dehydrogenase (short-subunit alcohol dehydrogenase family)